MKKIFTIYLSVTSRKKTNTFKYHSNKKSFEKIYKLVSFSLDNSLKNPKQTSIDKILEFAE